MAPHTQPPADVQGLRDQLASASPQGKLHLSQLHFPAAEAAEVIAAADPAHITTPTVELIARDFSGSDPEAALTWAAGLDESLSLPAAIRRMCTGSSRPSISSTPSTIS